MGKIGYVHSYESFGAVDGPGVRYVVFMQGCPLRCLFCHNPDTWEPKINKQIESQELAKKIADYKNFSKGGVTFTGGEPLMQYEFLEEVIPLLKDEHMHVAIDTSGIIPLEKTKNIFDMVDLVLLDIKDIDEDSCKVLTGASNKGAFAVLDYCESIGRDVWARHVLVPEYTLDYDKVDRMGKKLSEYTCIKKVEVLPFHKMGENKWEEVKTEYKLTDTRTPSSDEVKKTKEILISHGLLL